MIEKPTSGRANILVNENSLEIIIPTKRKWFLIVVTTIWIFGFTIGGKWMMDDMQNGQTPEIIQKFMLFGIAGWAIGVLCAIFTILWLTWGQEIVKINNGVLTLKKQIHSIGLTKDYQIDVIKNLTINPNSENGQLGFGTTNNFLNLKGGVIKFDYGMKTIKFGGGIDEAEGRHLIDVIRQNPNFKQMNFE